MHEIDHQRPKCLRIQPGLTVDPLTPAPPVTSLGLSSTSDVITLTKIGIIYTQLPQEEKLFPIVPSSQ